MVTLFQPSRNYKPLAKAVHVFDEASDAKWVPLNKSFTTLVKIVLRAAADRLHVANIAITFRCITHQGYHHLLLAGEEYNDTISALGAVEEFIISNEPASDDELGDGLSVSIDYQGKCLGYITPRLFAQGERKVQVNSQQLERGLEDVARDIVSIIKRYQTRYRAIFIYGDQYYWIGSSPALHQLGQNIEQLECERKPILIRGNKGTGKNIAARSLHSLRYKSILPFIESSCHEWQDGAASSILQALYAYAKGGTLYLRNVDRLSESNFKALQQFWLDSNNVGEYYGDAESVGIVFSVSRYHYAALPELTEWLGLHTRELLLPDLKARRVDLQDLVRFYVREYARSMEFDFSEAAWQLMQDFDWKENVDQLRGVIQKIALRVEEPLVQVSLLESILKE
ncbi:MAG TPA: sigma 54-interacting transcriptional regulator [Cellvibrio sp.]|nr:sigma 54-interacting transcriptional regulator [Cellvibrio sp.]